MAELDKILTKFVGGEVDTVLGAAFIVVDKNGKTLYSGGTGKLNFQPDSPPFTEDSLGWIASMTKFLVSVSVMQLMEKGVIGLDDDVGKIVPQLSNMDVLKGFKDDGTPIMEKQNTPMTLRYLVTHSSGFGYDVFDPDLIKWTAAIGRTVKNQSYSLEGYAMPLKFQPGEGWTYGVGLDWAGHVVEVLTKMTLGEYMQKHFFTPFEMSSTTFRLAEHPELTPRHAAMGVRKEPRGPLTLGIHPVPEVPPMESGGSGLFSTANDYSKFLVALLTGKILKKETIESMCKPQLPDNSQLMGNFHNEYLHDLFCVEYPMGLQVNYGLGGAVNMEDVPEKRRKGSLMWSGLANTHWWIDLQTGIAGVLTTQVMPPGDRVVGDLYDELEKAVYRDLVTEA